MSILKNFINKRNRAPEADEPEIPVSEPQQELIDLLTANIQQIKADYPQNAEHVDQFAEILMKKLSEYDWSQPAEETEEAEEMEEAEEEEPVNASAHLFISEDRMTAYACFFPPIAGGSEIDAATVQTELKYEGITVGIQEKVLASKLQARAYLDIFVIARGTAPQNGEDGKITDFFPREDSDLLSVKDGTLDLHSNPTNFIEKGNVICYIDDAEKGMDGVDVTGRILSGKDGTPIEIPCGANTQTSPDGKKLIASEGGRLFFRDDKFVVHKMYTIRGNFEESMGPLNQRGDVFIKGDVLKGSQIKADGDIIIQGSLRDAEVISEGSIVIQGKIQGGTSAKLTAKGNIGCLEIEKAEIKCKGDLYAEVVLDSTVKCDSNIYLLGGRGLLMSSTMHVGHSLLAKKIGNQANHKNTVYIGWQEEKQEKLKKLEESCEKDNEVLAQIKKNIKALKVVPQLSAEKKSVLEKLIEQRDLYEERQDAIEKEIKELRYAIYQTTDCFITCEELYPILEVFYSEQSVKVDTKRENCRILVSDRKLVVR